MRDEMKQLTKPGKSKSDCTESSQICGNNKQTKILSSRLIRHGKYILKYNTVQFSHLVHHLLMPA